MNENFHDLCKLDNNLTTWQASNTPLHFTVERDYGKNVGTDGLVLYSYTYELEKLFIYDPADIILSARSANMLTARSVAGILYSS